MIAPPEKVVVAAVGFVDLRELQPSERAIDLSVALKVHVVWNSPNAKVFQHQGYLRKSPSWLCTRSSAF